MKTHSEEREQQLQPFAVQPTGNKRRRVQSLHVEVADGNVQAFGGGRKRTAACVNVP